MLEQLTEITMIARNEYEYDQFSSMWCPEGLYVYSLEMFGTFLINI